MGCRLRCGGSAAGSLESGEDSSGESSAASSGGSSCTGHDSILDGGAAGSGFHSDQVVLGSVGGGQTGRRSSVERRPVCGGEEVDPAVAEGGGSTSSGAVAPVLAKEERGNVGYCFPANTEGASSSIYCPFHIVFLGDPRYC